MNAGSLIKLNQNGGKNDTRNTRHSYASFYRHIYSLFYAFNNNEEYMSREIYKLIVDLEPFDYDDLINLMIIVKLYTMDCKSGGEREH